MIQAKDEERVRALEAKDGVIEERDRVIEERDIVIQERDAEIQRLVQALKETRPVV